MNISQLPLKDCLVRLKIVKNANSVYPFSIPEQISEEKNISMLASLFTNYSEILCVRFNVVHLIYESDFIILQQIYP